MKVWENAIKDFSYYLRIERGLSENTAVSYSSDLEKLADIEKMRFHQKPVLQHDDELVNLDVGNARLPVYGDGDAPVLLRHQRLPALAPMLLIVGLFLPLLLQKPK